MYNGMYGSPFPKLNPRVNYKTALERAGFDVKRGPDGQELEPGKTNDGSLEQSRVEHGRSSQRNASQTNLSGGGMVAPTYSYSKANNIRAQVKPMIQVTAASSMRSYGTGNPVSVNQQNTRPLNNDGNMANTNTYSDLPPQPQQQQQQQQQQQIHNELARSNNGSTFNFETSFDNQIMNNDINPIEKSFNMLTQNDTQSEMVDFTSVNEPMNDININKISSNAMDHVSHQNEENIQSSSNSRKSFALNDLDDFDSYKEPNYYQERPAQDATFDTKTNNRESRVESLNFKPNSNLHISMHPDDENIPLAWNKNNVDLPINKITPIEEDIHTPALNIPDLSIDIPARSEHRNATQEVADEEIDTYSPINESNTNLHVEALIAQLDDVSFSRNEKLNQGQQIDKDNNSFLNPTKPSLLAVNDNTTRLKKSSAYLSGFPKDGGMMIKKPSLNVESVYMTNESSNSLSPYDFTVSSSPSPPPLPQNISYNDPSADGVVDIDEERESVTTPTDKGEKDNNKQNELRVDTSFRNSDIGSLNITTPTFYKFDQNANQSFYSSSTSLLLPKGSIPPPSERSVRNSESDLTKEKTSPSKSKIDTIHAKKYPPGQGPCRTCGLEVEGKGIFSKKSGELSGQWHKKCFHCYQCDITFNKKTPCYILDDMPYCQQHYHETNNSICKICNQFIEGECLENDKKERFHVNCLTCFLCHKPITEDYFIFNDEIPLCADHDMNSLVENGLTLGPDEDNVKSDQNHRENTVRKRRTRLINFQESMNN